MRAVDTNILARFYLHDDAPQGRIAANVLSAGDIFVPKTVILKDLGLLGLTLEQIKEYVTSGNRPQ